MTTTDVAAKQRFASTLFCTGSYVDRKMFEEIFPTTSASPKDSLQGTLEHTVGKIVFKER
jgi:hypothetical protein